MIRLSESLGRKVLEQLNCLYRELGMDRKLVLDNGDFDFCFEEQDLNYIVSLVISKEDIVFLREFKSLENLTIMGFSSVSDEELVMVLNECLNLRKLIIHGQDGVINVSLKGVCFLEELVIANCRNLQKIESLGDCVSLKSLTFYNNVSYKNYDSLFDFCVANRHIEFKYGIQNYEDAMCYLEQRGLDLSVFDDVEWIESYGEVEKSFSYTNREAFLLLTLLKDIVGKYCYVGDDYLERFGILYSWFVQNIRLVLPGSVDYDLLKDVHSVYDVFTYNVASKEFYSLALQSLLSVGNVPTELVWSDRVLNSIGYYNGKSVLSYGDDFGYFVLRVSLGNVVSYVDPVWNVYCRNSKYEKYLRLLLVSEEEMKERHVLVNVSDIGRTKTYSAQEVLDLLSFSEDRLRGVDEFFFEIEKNHSSMNGYEFNCVYCQHEMFELKEDLEQMDAASEEYRIVLEKFSKSEKEYIEQKKHLVALREERLQEILKHKKEILLHYLGEDLLNEEARKVERVFQRKVDHGLVSPVIYQLIVECLSN